MLTYWLYKAPEKHLTWLIKVWKLSEDGIVEYLHDLFCPCDVDTELDDDCAA